MGPTMWQIRKIHEEFDPYYVYENQPHLISIKLNHGGMFTKRPGRKYMNGKVDYIDIVDCDEFSVHELDTMIKEIGYTTVQPMWHHFLVPESDLDYGLHALGSDLDVLNLLKYTNRYKLIEVYTEHWMTTVNTYLKSPQQSKVVIDELPGEEPPEIKRCKWPDKKASSSSCKKQLLLGWNETEVRSTQSQEHGEHVGSGEKVQDQVVEPSEKVKKHVGEVDELGYRPELHEEEHVEHVAQEFDPNEHFDPFNSTVDSDYMVDKADRVDKEDMDWSDEVDSDYMVDKVDKDVVDMSNFNSTVDWEAEWVGQTENIVEDDNLDGNPAMEFDEFETDSDSDFERIRNRKLKSLRKQQPPIPEGMKTSFFVGQKFGNKKEIKSAITLHSIETRRDLMIVKNDKVRVRVICKGRVPNETLTPSADVATKLNESGPTCPWKLHISTTTNERTWVVKTYSPGHKCLQQRKVIQCTASFISKQIEETVGPNPTIPIGALTEQLQKKLAVGISRQKVFRAKNMAMNRVMGSYSLQYSWLRNYVLELQRTNSDTTVKLDVEIEPNLASTTRKFKRIYVCISSLKQGLACKNELLGLDGSFMKAPYPGQILTAVGVDPNNGTYPLAYTIVESECTDSWAWFLEHLGDGLDLQRNSNFTFISDRQKGIIPAIARVFPSAEHRYCLRHIHENMKKSWRGKEYKDLLWKCATATTVPEFDRCMRDLRTVNQDAYNWLKEIPPHTWTRSHFTGRSHCDVLLNNMCEVFNRQLVDGRDKPIIMALEFIREYLMKRIVKVQEAIARCDGPLTPTATKLLDKVKSAASQYNVTWNGGDHYQVTGPWMDQCVVNPTEKECSCRKWELTGIPCKHTVATIWHMASNGLTVGIHEDWVHDCYTLDTWKEVYGFKVYPINGRDKWPVLDCTITLTAPKHHIQIGRPKKKRRKTDEELSEPIVKGSKLRRHGQTVTCSKCKKRGHNSRTCKGQENRGA